MSLTLAEEINDTALGLEVIGVSINKKARNIAWKSIPLGFLLLSQGGVYTIATTL